ncbi:MAG: PD-(D/E)XK nuclease family protein [Leptolyngbyaceae cyanobacterium SM1_1_3]|nr:PD-(D/E)XK nuclease family protein [Leptolyngbyaceae cyanobacterium SM1_1_3]NJN03266.1 PD-(D/E)XK nuclease family protein [Leptolyngbyaceae cyanobacterium RM1_1_2]
MTSSPVNAQPPLALSQGLLNLLTTCPRKFQYTYFDELGLPIAPEQQASVTWGSQFHLLMQQRELGLPIDSLPAMETDFRESLEALIAVAPDLFMPDLSPTDPVTFRQSEHRRTVEFGGYLLTVIYDLLILRSEQGQIIDWKTYLQPCSRLVLAQDWQTRLYPYVLAETTTLAPSQISITYWFVRHRDRQSNCLQPQQLTFAYGDQQHEQVRQDLSYLTTQLSQWRSQQALPKVDLAKGICPRCPFAIRCQRSLSSMISAQSSDLPALAEIEEVAL